MRGSYSSQSERLSRCLADELTRREPGLTHWNVTALVFRVLHANMTLCLWPVGFLTKHSLKLLKHF